MAKKLSDSKVILADAAQKGLRRVLFVTALPLELAAVRRGLKNLGSATMVASTVEFEQFTVAAQEWLVVAGECGAGTHEAQLFVTKAIQEFGPFELILFVGVAATRKPDDAPIGSVIISKLVYLAGPGKYKDGKFLGRARQLQPDKTLISYAEKVARDQEWHARITPPYADRNPQDAGYPQPFPPPALVCPIVSVEAVSADPDSSLESHITQTYQDATGLEMEAYGALMAASQETTPCIVIRGISDDRIAKEAKLDKILQPIAAGHAAAFAFELLDMWAQNVLPPAVNEPTISQSPAANSAVSVAAAGERVSLVLHLKGTGSDYPQERREQILAAVRKITGDADAELGTSEEGSFHLFVSVLDSALKGAADSSFSTELAEHIGAEFIGVTTEEAFRALDKVKSEILSASEPLLTWPQALPGGERLDRPELHTLLQRALLSEGSTTALLGAPGSGKTALLSRVADELTTRRVPILAIKADLLNPDIATEGDLQEALGLSDLPSVLLSELARTQQVVLLIDQLDALASYLDLRTGRLSVLLNLVRALGGRRNIGIVLSARQFEFEHDVRLRSVRAENLFLELPPWSKVLEVLQRHGVTADSWPSDAQELLRTPQALTIFLKLPRSASDPPHRNYLAMLEELWQTQLLALPQGPRIVRLATTLAEDMAKREALWVARSRYDEHAQDLEALIAAGVATLSDTKSSIGFSHQTVLDFALSRSFAEHEGRLSSYIAGREASLFIRPKLWSALTYLRDTEISTYDSELRAIWASETLRPHLRQLLLEFLGQQSTPTPTEMTIYKSALTSAMRRFALESMVGSPGWFEHFKYSEIPRAMTDVKDAGVAGAILSRVASSKAEQVLTLIEKHWLPNSEFDGNLWFVLQDLMPWSDRVLETATALVARSDIAPVHVEHLAATIGTDQPEMALRLALAKLQADLNKAKVVAETRHAEKLANPAVDTVTSYLSSPREALTQVVEGPHQWDALEALAKAIPQSFLDILWPWFTDLLSALRLYVDEWDDLSFPLSYSLDFRFDGEGGNDLPEYPVLAAFRVAVESLAEKAEPALLDWLNANESENAAPAQRLFAHGLASAPERFAKRSLAFLLGDLRRLLLGHTADLSDTSKRLVRLSSPHWSDGELAHFSSALLDYSPTPLAGRNAKSRRSFHRLLARTKLEILEELPQDRLTDHVLAHIERERRRFGERTQAAQITGAQWIDSPMSSDEMTKATDQQVAKAFQRLPDATNWDHPRSWMKGGNIQLSRSFADFAKSLPERAIKILDQMTPDIGSRAAGYALDAMGETADPDSVLAMIKKLEGRGFTDEEYRNGVAHSIDRLVRRNVDIDDSVLDILCSWLVQSKGSPESVGQVNAGNDSEPGNIAGKELKEKPEDRESTLWGQNSFSIVPHGNYPTLEAIAQILLRKGNHERLLAILFAHIERDEDERVWKAMLHFLRYVDPEDKTTLVRFVSKLFNKYPELLNSVEGAVALAHLQRTIPDVVRVVLSGWTNSPKSATRQTYGELVTLIWLVQPALEWSRAMLEELVTSGSADARRGAAYAAVNVWAEDDTYRDRAAALLTRIVSKGESESWTAVLDIFRLSDSIAPEEAWLTLLRAIIEQIPKQATFPSAFVLDRLQTLLPHEAELVANFALTLTAKWKSELGDIRTGTAADAPTLVDIALTLHRLGDSTREMGTQLFEELIEINAYTARDTLQQIDNRLSNRAISSRPRLPRRQRSARRRSTQ